MPVVILALFGFLVAYGLPAGALAQCPATHGAVHITTASSDSAHAATRTASVTGAHCADGPGSRVQPAWQTGRTAHTGSLMAAPESPAGPAAVPVPTALRSPPGAGVAVLVLICVSRT